MTYDKHLKDIGDYYPFRVCGGSNRCGTGAGRDRRGASKGWSYQQVANAAQRHLPKDFPGKVDRRFVQHLLTMGRDARPFGRYASLRAVCLALKCWDEIKPFRERT